MAETSLPRRPAGAIEARGVIHVHPAAEGGVAALRGLDLTVEPAELVTVVGPSGSGKSTLLRLLAGLERPTAGSILSAGVALERASEAELRQYRTGLVGTVEQHYWRSLSPYLPVGRTVELPLRLRGVARPERERRVAAILERVGLAGRADALPSELSGGEQQRIAVATALVIEPRILLADEPTGELDDATAASLVRLMRELLREVGATGIVVTHDEQLESAADRIVYLRDGRAIAERRAGRLRTAVDASGWRAPAPVRAQAVGPPATTAVDAGSAVRLERVSRSYGTGGIAAVALDGISAAFGSGGFHVVTGPSGSGKSTLLRLVTGLDVPDAGRVVTLGVDLGELDRDALAILRARRIGIVDQAPRLISFLSAIENVVLGLDLRGLGGPDADERASAALERLGVLALSDRRPDVLSAGERTRVAIARAISGEPELLVLDEPTSTLDRRNARAIARLLAGLASPSTTVIAATHDRDLIAVASERLDLRAGASARLEHRPMPGAPTAQPAGRADGGPVVQR
ncbi:MAG TPA: ATP-binding cassette domain-containing protein [Candidatus Limnocylindrales bacterium]|nr:ATP-binding cassette domain-containing protein [Candidatus Limnocylindrales bacterium]